MLRVCEFVLASVLLGSTSVAAQPSPDPIGSPQTSPSPVASDDPSAGITPANACAEMLTTAKRLKAGASIRDQGVMVGIRHTGDEEVAYDSALKRDNERFQVAFRQCSNRNAQDAGNAYMNEALVFLKWFNRQYYGVDYELALEQLSQCNSHFYGSEVGAECSVDRDDLFNLFETGFLKAPRP